MSKGQKKKKSSSHASHTFRGLRYHSKFTMVALTIEKTLQVLASSCLPRQIINFPSNLLTRFDQTPLRLSLFNAFCCR